MTHRAVRITGWHVADSSKIDGTVFIWNGDKIAINVNCVDLREDTVNPIRVLLAKLALFILSKMDTEINFTNDLFSKG